jgi:hypothetical protein
MGAVKEKLIEIADLVQELIDSGIPDEELDEYLQAILTLGEYQLYHEHKDIIYRELGYIIEYLSSDESIEMPRLFEYEDKYYNVDVIAKIALSNINKWTNDIELKHIVNELNNMAGKVESIIEPMNIFKDFISQHIDNFFSLFLKYNRNIDEDFLYSNKEQIVNNIVEHAFSIKSSKEDDILTRAKIKKEEPLDYSEMSQYDLQKEIDKALDTKDFETLKKIQPYLKEGFLKSYVEDILNENR